MPDVKEVINGLEMSYKYSNVDENNTLVPQQLVLDALALLKAQEPVEPVFNAMVETDMSYWSCGACGAFIYGNAYPHMAKDTMPKYCGYCGRAVKWE